MVKQQFLADKWQGERSITIPLPVIKGGLL
jgi:hypothetical protein